MDEGTTRPLHIHAYPKSSGIVIRVIGREIDQNCGAVAEAAREAVLAARFLGFFAAGVRTPTGGRGAFVCSPKIVASEPGPRVTTGTFKHLSADVVSVAGRGFDNSGREQRQAEKFSEDREVAKDFAYPVSKRLLCFQQLVIFWIASRLTRLPLKDMR